MPKALICNKFGNLNDLKVQNIQNLEPKENQVSVEVMACGLNFFDLLIVSGKYQLKPQLPFSPGGEFAGKISKLGKNVTQFKIGDKVMACCSYGGCREFININADDLILMDEKIDYVTAAGVIITYGTMLYALVERASIKKGQYVCILGASGGIGSAAIEIARAKQAIVIAAVATEQKCRICQNIGAQYTVNYQKHDLKNWLKQNVPQLDIVVDPVGGENAQKALRCLKSRGKFLVLGFAAGNITQMPLNLVLLKNIDIIGINWAQFVQNKKDKYKKNIALITQWILERKIKPQIEKVYGIENTINALEIIKNRKAKGKIVIDMRNKFTRKTILP